MCIRDSKCTTRAIERSRKISEAPRDRSRTGPFLANVELAVRNPSQSLRGTNGTVAPNKTPKRTPSNAAQAVIGNVRLSHPDRVYWEDAGVSKRDLAEFYTHIWKWMRPHVTGRPIALLRCPEGAAGQCFFQKHAAAGIATEHLHLVSEKGDKIISLDDLAGLIALVQAGVLEIHTRGTTSGDRDRAERLVFDLDPGPGTGWSDVVAAGGAARVDFQDARLHQRDQAGEIVERDDLVALFGDQMQVLGGDAGRGMLLEKALPGRALRAAQ